MYQLAKPAEALSHLRQAETQFKVLDNPWWVAESMDWEAMVLHMLEDGAALRVGRRAVRRYRALDPHRPETEARMLEHVGTICLGRRDYERGRASYEAALQVSGGIRDLTRIARVYHGLGMCHFGNHGLVRAAELLLKAITLYEAEQRIATGPMRMGLPMVENDLGLVMMEQGNLKRAEELFRAALHHYVACGTEQLRSHTLLSLGEMRQRQGLLDEALDFVVQGIECASANNEMVTVTTGYSQLGELYAARGDHQLADAAFQRALGMLQEAGLEARALECMRAYEQVLSKRRQSRRHAQDFSA
jgi:tetratricopeptide (TPR) repeat protein